MYTEFLVRIANFASLEVKEFTYRVYSGFVVDLFSLTVLKFIKLCEEVTVMFESVFPRVK